ncbi:MAG: hypothetical protein KDA87_03695 [Planctomycetales bacterium]|nr:hypothetical protein [Planctomycetales bacterium]
MQNGCHLNLFAWLCAWFVCVGTRVQAADLGTIVQLRDQHSYAAAESMALRMFRESTTTESDRIRIAVELLRTYSAHALATPQQQRSFVWNEANQFVIEFQQSGIRSPLAVLAHIQAALTRLAQAEIDRLEAEVTAASPKQLDAIRGRLRQVSADLVKTDDQIGSLMRTAGRSTGLTVTQMQRLRDKTRLHLADAKLQLAQTFPAESPDRVHALNEALQLFEDLAGIVSNPPIAAQANVSKITCHRLLGNEAETISLAQKLIEQSQDDQQLQAQALLELAKLAIDSDTQLQADVFLNQIDKLNVSNRQLLAEVILVYIESRLAATAASSVDDDEIERLMQRMQPHGAYWLRRAELLVARYSNQGAPNVTATTLKADQAVRQGDLVIATQMYDQAVAELSNEQQDQAFEIRFRAAAVLHQHRQHVSAAKRFASLAYDLPKMPRSSVAHYLAIVNYATSLAELSDLKERQSALAAYEKMLVDHVQLWPDSERVDEVRLWLAKLQLQTLRPADAMAMAQQVKPNSAVFAEALSIWDQAARQRWQLQQASSQTEANSGANEALRYLTKLRDANLSEPKRWLIELIVLDIRTTMLDQANRENERQLEALEAAFQANQKVTLAERSRVIRLVSMVQRRYAADAMNEFTATKWTQFELLVRLVEQLDKQDGRMDASTQATARFQLTVINQLKSNFASTAFDEATQAKLVRSEATALALVDDVPRALAVYRTWLEQKRQDGKAQWDFGVWLDKMADATNHPEVKLAAVEHWRTLGRSVRPNSERWYQCKLQQASALVRNKQLAEAGEMLRLLETLHPDLGGNTTRADFRRLIQQVNSANE